MKWQYRTIILKKFKSQYLYFFAEFHTVLLFLFHVLSENDDLKNHVTCVYGSSHLSIKLIIKVEIDNTRWTCNVNKAEIKKYECIFYKSGNPETLQNLQKIEKGRWFSLVYRFEKRYVELHYFFFLMILEIVPSLFATLKGKNNGNTQ